MLRPHSGERFCTLLKRRTMSSRFFGMALQTIPLVMHICFRPKIIPSLRLRYYGTNGLKGEQQTQVLSHCSSARGTWEAPKLTACSAHWAVVLSNHALQLFSWLCFRRSATTNATTGTTPTSACNTEARCVYRLVGTAQGGVYLTWSEFDVAVFLFDHYNSSRRHRLAST